MILYNNHMIIIDNLYLTTSLKEEGSHSTKSFRWFRWLQIRYNIYYIYVHVCRYDSCNSIMFSSVSKTSSMFYLTQRTSFHTGCASHWWHSCCDEVFAEAGMALW